MTDELTDAETLRRELRALRYRTALMNDRRVFDEVDTLLSVAEKLTEEVVTRLRQATRSPPQVPR